MRSCRKAAGHAEVQRIGCGLEVAYAPVFSARSGDSLATHEQSARRDADRRRASVGLGRVSHARPAPAFSNSAILTRGRSRGRADRRPRVHLDARASDRRERPRRRSHVATTASRFGRPTSTRRHPRRPLHRSQSGRPAWRDAGRRDRGAVVSVHRRSATRRADVPSRDTRRSAQRFSTRRQP